MKIKDIKEMIGNQLDNAEIHLYAMMNRLHVLLKVGENCISLPIEY